MPLNSKKMKEIVVEGLRTYDEAYTADREERRLAVDDVVFTFSEDGQWDGRTKLRRLGRPRYTINKLAAAVNEINGSYRQNRIELKARAEQDTAKDEADTFNGLLRAITENSDSKLAKDIAFKSITVSGFGAMRVASRFCANNPFEQELALEPIYESLERIWFDPYAKHPTGRDGRYVHDVVEMDRKEFKRKYPKAQLVTFPDQDVTLLQRRWGMGDTTKDKVLVSDYYRKEIKEQKVHLLTDGSVMNDDDFVKVVDELAKKSIFIVRTKTAETTRIMCYRMSGSEILEEPKEVPGKWLPIIRVLGYYEWQNGVLHYRGIVRAAKDPSRIYNYTTSESISDVALAPKNKVLATPKHIAGNEEDWNNISNAQRTVLRYNHDPDVPNGPREFNPSQPQPALLQQAQQAELDLQSVIGRRSPAQGEAPRDRSGRAILALQRQDDSVTFELLDNLAVSVEHAADVLMGMIPATYDNERQVMILADDEEEELVTINEQVKDEETGDTIIKNDVNRKYRVIASVGPAFETKRTEMVNVLTTLSEDDAFKPIIADLMAKNMDFPFSQELTKRIRRQQLQQGIVEPTEEEAKEIAKAQQAQQQDPMFKLQQEIQMKDLQLTLAAKEAAVNNTIANTQNLLANVGNLNAATAEKFEKSKASNADVEKTKTANYTAMIDSMLKKVEAGGVITEAEQSTMAQMLESLDASIREDFNARIQAEVTKRKALQA